MSTACGHGWNGSSVFKRRSIAETKGRKEGNVLFNDALNTFLFTVIWRQTYVKVPLNCERGNPLPPQGLTGMVLVAEEGRKCFI